MDTITTYSEFSGGKGLAHAARQAARKLVLAGLSLKKKIQGQGWIAFPYYHHVFDDEQRGFERQLKYLKNFGDFISMDDACTMINGTWPIDGRYFCVSFDDGFENCYTNMLDITSRLDVPVIIYLPTKYIDLDAANPEQQQVLREFYHEQDNKVIPMLSWAQCREMMSHKVSFGSHTVSHANLMKLTPAEIEEELLVSRKEIEQELQTDCPHFACPWGKAMVNFDPAVTTPISRKLGYTSFATTERGKMTRGGNCYELKRDHMLANWEIFQLKYFLGK